MRMQLIFQLSRCFVLLSLTPLEQKPWWGKVLEFDLKQDFLQTCAGHQSPPLSPPHGQMDRPTGLGASSGRSCWTESSGQTQQRIPEHVSLQHCHQAHKSRWTSALFINQRTLKAGIRIHSLSMTIRSQKNRRNLQNPHQSDWQTMGTTGERFSRMNDLRFGLNWLPSRDF